jgi:hypothetical protein
MNKLLSARWRPLLASAIAGSVAAVALLVGLSGANSGAAMAIFADPLGFSVAFQDPFGFSIAIFENPFDSLGAIFENPFTIMG